MRFSASLLLASASWLLAQAQECSEDNKNWFCREVTHLSYQMIRRSGFYRVVTDMRPDGTCEFADKHFSATDTELDEPVSIHIRGPIRFYALAVYYLVSFKTEPDAPVSRRLRSRGHGHQRLHELQKKAFEMETKVKVNGEVVYHQSHADLSPQPAAPAPLAVDAPDPPSPPATPLAAAAAAAAPPPPDSTAAAAAAAAAAAPPHPPAAAAAAAAAPPPPPPPASTAATAPPPLPDSTAAAVTAAAAAAAAAPPPLAAAAAAAAPPPPHLAADAAAAAVAAAPMTFQTVYTNSLDTPPSPLRNNPLAAAPMTIKKSFYRISLGKWLRLLRNNPPAAPPMTTATTYSKVGSLEDTQPDPSRNTLPPAPPAPPAPIHPTALAFAAPPEPAVADAPLRPAAPPPVFVTLTLSSPATPTYTRPSDPLPDAKLPLPDAKLPLPDAKLPLPDAKLPPTAAGSSAKDELAASSGQSGGSWKRKAYYNAEKSTLQNMVFMGNYGVKDFKDFTTWGNSLTYLNASGTGGSTSPQILANTLVPSNKEFSIFSSEKCDKSCGFSRDNNTAHKGFPTNIAVFLLRFQMPHDDGTGRNGDTPAIWFLNSRIPRTQQYGNCSCWGNVEGCGEFDVYEALKGGDERCKSAFHMTKGAGSSDYFRRPVHEPITVAVVYYAPNSSVTILRLPDEMEEFPDSLDHQKVLDWIRGPSNSSTSGIFPMPA